MSAKLVMFVHGLGGDPTKTWRKFPSLIASDKDLADFDVGFFGYPTSLFRLPFGKRCPKIQTLAKALRTELDTKYPGHDDVTLVCHSLGGLIARKYLVDEVKKSVPLRVKRLMLYAVPNNGADLAAVAKHVSWRHGQLTQLCKRSDLITDLNEDWFISKLPDRLELRYVVAAADGVVDEESAQGYWGNLKLDVIPDAAHKDVVKPADASDLRYLVFRDFVLGHVAPAPSIDAYETASGKALNSGRTARKLRQKGHRVVGFDLDGTLLRGLEFSWTLVWQHLGFPEKVRKEGMRRYMAEETTYRAWCEWACAQYRQRNLKREDFAEITQSLTVTNNLREAIELLRGDGFVTAIVSGGIDRFIAEKIPDAEELFDYIFINKLKFDDVGIVCGVDATPFDFEGKAAAMELLCAKYGASMQEAVFVGEGFNDGYVAKKVGLSVAYPPTAYDMKAAAHVEIKEDDLLKVVERVL